MLSDLRAEHAAIAQAIYILERFALGGRKRRGRPPAWMSGTGDRRGRFIRTPAMRARASAAQRRRWARVKKAKAES